MIVFGYVPAYPPPPEGLLGPLIVSVLAIAAFLWIGHKLTSL